LQFFHVTWASVLHNHRRLKSFCDIIPTSSIHSQIVHAFEQRPQWQVSHRKYLVDFRVAPHNVLHEDMYSDVEDDIIIVNSVDDDVPENNLEDD
jgi:hypothetical protein